MIFRKHFIGNGKNCKKKKKKLTIFKKNINNFIIISVIRVYISKTLFRKVPIQMKIEESSNIETLHDL